MVMLDFQKTFELVAHCIVLTKLEKLGVPFFLVQWVCAFLYQRRQRVKIGSATSVWLYPNPGKTQGTCLGPLLFLVMLSDLICELSIVKYAGDSTGYEIVKLGQISIMQRAVVQCADWPEKTICS